MAIAAMIGLAGPMVATPAVAATAPITALASLEKKVSASEVAAGGTFTYAIQVGCSSIIDNGCRGAVLTDVVPAQFEVVSVQVGGIPTATPVISGQSVLVVFLADLGDGTAGILDATTGVITINARVRTDLPYEANGVQVWNNASMTGVNFEDVQHQVAVAPIVPLKLAVTTTKAFAPQQAVAVAGTPVTATLGATNTSNAIVDAMRITDPTDPTAMPNPFTYLGFTGFGAVTAPAGATAAVYEVFFGGAWVMVNAAGPFPPTVSGARVTFTGAMAPGASGSVALGLEHTAAAEGLLNNLAVRNTIHAAVSQGVNTAHAAATDTYTLLQNTVQVEARKTFDPDVITPGETTVAELEASNLSSFPVNSLTITEPSSGSFDSSLAFAGWSSPITWPAGTTAAEVRYSLATPPGGNVAVSFATGTVPALPAGVTPEQVTGVEIVFTGQIAVGAGASIGMEFGVNPNLARPLPLAVRNEVLVTGVNGATTGTDLADDTVTIYDEQIETYVGKRIRPSQVLAVPGERVTVSLTGGTTGRPRPPAVPEGSTTDAERIVVQDPVNPAATPVDPWWNAFDATSITLTPVPAGVSLTVNYWSVSAGAWVALAADIRGPQVFSQTIPANVQSDIGGLQFVYTSDTGFPPGTDLAPNFTSSLRQNARDGSGPAFDAAAGGLIANCASTAGFIDAGAAASHTAVMQPADCPVVELVPTSPGVGNLVTKTFGISSSGGDKSVIARSGDTIPARLAWSTCGYSDLQRVELTDVANPAGTPIANSVFDPFNLTRVQPITAASDPLIRFDAVQAVQLFNGASWVTASNNPCTATCNGQFPGMNLTAAEQRTTVGVRLVFVENPQRAAVIAGLPSAE